MIMDDSLSLFLISLKIMRQLKSKDLKYNVETSKIRLNKNRILSNLFVETVLRLSLNLRRE